MFEFGRELRRMFARRPRAPGVLLGGEAGLHELLDLQGLRGEARTAETGAARVAGRDRARRQLAAARLWRELARRSGDGEALRKAAASAQAAAECWIQARRGPDWAWARLEQAMSAMLGLGLFGDGSLESAAETAAADVQRAGGGAAMIARSLVAQLRARRAIQAGGPVDVRAAARAFNDPLAFLESAGRRDSRLRRAAVEARIARSELLVGAGQRLNDEDLLRAGVGDLTAAQGQLAALGEPLSSARVAVEKAAAMAALGETTGDLSRLARCVGALTKTMDALTREQSPLDWARGQIALARALAALGEATENETALHKALDCYDRAGHALGAAPGLLLRAEAANGRGRTLARLAELTGDVKVLDAAEAAFKAELVAQRRPEPVAWAMLQVQLGQVYATRLALRGRDCGERAAAAFAFQAALEVFAEQGLRSLAAIASEGLERLAGASVG